MLSPALETPEPVTCLLQEALTAYQAQDWTRAQALAEAALALDAVRVDAWTLIGMVARKSGHPEQASAAYRRALAIDPCYADAHRNLANLLREQAKLFEAVSHYETAVALRPDWAEIHNALGGTWQAIGALDTALACFARALSLAPGEPDYHWDHALCLLLAGRYREGWDEYEWRWQRGLPPPRGFTQPQWQGEPLAGRRVLVHCEQGFGDAIQFLRFIPKLKALGAVVILEALAPLHGLIRASFAVDELVANGESLPSFDLHIPLVSLARCFGVTLQTLAESPSPYLQPPAAAQRAWASRMPHGRLRVGLVWAGNPNVKNDRWRSPRFAALQALLECRDAQFYLLQMGDGRRDIEGLSLPAHVTDLGSEIRDFSDTAAILCKLDVLISSDTSVAHLAGALGCKTYLLLHAWPDWRWLLKRSDCPWYPSLHLFRQGAIGDWQPVVQAVARSLDAMLGTTKPAQAPLRDKEATMENSRALEAAAAAQPTYYSGLNHKLLEQVPAKAQKIFEVGCGHGNFGAALKARNPALQYYAMEVVPEAAAVAARKLDHVICGSIESAALVEGDFDCVIFGDVLEHLRDPLAVLKKIRPMLKADGCVLCSVPNVQHHSVLAALLAGDFQYQDMGLLDRTHLRFFTYASFIKLMLDAGFVPQIVDTITAPTPADFFDALKSAFAHLRQDAERARYYTSAHQYIFRGQLAAVPPEDEARFPISFIVPTNDRRVLNDNFLSSPIFRGKHPHQIVLLERQPSAAHALETGIRHAAHDFVVYVHQDVYLPEHWDRSYCQSVREAAAGIPEAALFGVYGARVGEHDTLRHGRVMDRHWYRADGGALPAVVESLDELLLGFYKHTYPGTDQALGYHLYGTDLACRYRDMGKLSVAVDALCFHNSGLGGTLPNEFYAGAKLLGERWRKYLPIATACVTISGHTATP